MKTPHASFQHPASHEFHQIIWKTIHCLITNTKTEYLPCFIVKSINKIPPYLMAYYCLLWHRSNALVLLALPHNKHVLTYSTLDCLTWEQWPAAWTGILDWHSTSSTRHGIISEWMPGSIQSILTSVNTLFSSHLKKKISTVHSDIYIFNEKPCSSTYCVTFKYMI